MALRAPQTAVTDALSGAVSAADKNIVVSSLQSPVYANHMNIIARAMMHGKHTADHRNLGNLASFDQLPKIICNKNTIGMWHEGQYQ